MDPTALQCNAVPRRRNNLELFCCLLNLWDHTKKCCMLNLCYLRANINFQLLVLIYVCITEKRISKLVYVTCLSLKVVRKTSIWNTFQRFLMVQSPIKRPNLDLPEQVLSALQVCQTDCWQTNISTKQKLKWLNACMGMQWCSEQFSIHRGNQHTCNERKLGG